MVGEAAAGDGEQPGARVVGDALGRPLRGGGDERLLHRVLAAVELPVPPDQGAEDRGPELGEQILQALVGTHQLILDARALVSLSPRRLRPKVKRV